MRIAMIGLQGIPATHGGVERAVEETGAELAQSGLDVTVYCRSSHYAQRLDEYRGMRLKYLPAPTGKGVEALVHSALAAIDAAPRGYDIVHFHALGPGLFSPISQYGSRARVVQTIHGMDDQRSKWGRVAQTALSTGAQFSARVPDETIVVSHSLARHYDQTWQRRTTVIPNAVRPPASPDRTVLAEHGLAADPYLLFVGRLVPEKGVLDLLDAFRGVDTGSRLLVAGGSSHTDGYAAEVRARAAQDPRVTLLGQVHQPLIGQLYAHASAFVLPSHLEGMPLVLLEAASYGLPVIASDIDPHVEVLRADSPGRRLFPVGDVPGLQKALTQALEGLPAEREGALLLQQQVLSWTWADVAAATHGVYRTALAGSKSTRSKHTRAKHRRSKQNGSKPNRSKEDRSKEDPSAQNPPRQDPTTSNQSRTGVAP